MQENPLRAIATLTTLALAVALSGCSTCVSVEATYDEAWEATRLALVRVPHMSAAGPAGRYDAGTFEVDVAPPNALAYFSYHAQIKPVGGTDQEDRKICVRVLEVDRTTMNEPDAEGVKSSRRQDLEELITRRIEQSFMARDQSE